MNVKLLFAAMLGGLLSFAACSSDGNGDSGQKKAQPIDVLSFNVRVDNAVDGDHVWGNRKRAVVTMIGRQKPTVMGLQEAQPHQITYLAKQCARYGRSPSRNGGLRSGGMHGHFLQDRGSGTTG